MYSATKKMSWSKQSPPCLFLTAATTVRLQSTIKQLRDTLKEQEQDHRTAEDRTRQAEGDARDKDKQLNEALTRMREYETVSWRFH